MAYSKSGTNNYDNTVNVYLKQVQRTPTLSREEEYALADQALKGDLSAIQKLVEANLRFVVAMALKYRRYGLPLTDLISEGNVGLMVAVRKFDTSRGTRFVTYAGYWIRAFILDYIVKSASLVGGGSGALRSKVFFRLRRERAKLANVVQDMDEQRAILAAQFGVTPQKIAEMSERLDGHDVYLDTPVVSDSATTLLDNLVDHNPENDQESYVIQNEHQRRLHHGLEQALSALDRRERYIVEQRYLGEDEISLASLGRRLGVSRERARQLEARARSKLKLELEELMAA